MRTAHFSAREPRWTPWILILLGIGILPGCSAPFDLIDPSLASQARIALRQERPPPVDEDEGDVEPYSESEKSGKSVIIGELLAIFPGFFWHGLGHRYAGDHETAREISSTGQWGYLLTAIGGGILVGGYFLDKEDNDLEPFATSLYVTGGITGGIGIGFFLTAWFYDMIDTPRAVRSGGKPPPGSPFKKDLESIGADR